MLILKTWRKQLRDEQWSYPPTRQSTCQKRRRPAKNKGITGDFVRISSQLTTRIRASRALNSMQRSATAIWCQMACNYCLTIPLIRPVSWLYLEGVSEKRITCQILIMYLQLNVTQDPLTSFRVGKSTLWMLAVWKVRQSQVLNRFPNKNRASED